MTNLFINNLSFDEWHMLSKEDPAEFENQRQKAIDEAINQSLKASQQRLRQLQWRINMERRRSKNHLDSCIRIYSMMLDSLHGEKGLSNRLQSLIETMTTQQPFHEIEQTARVIPIKLN